MLCGVCWSDWWLLPPSYLVLSTRYLGSARWLLLPVVLLLPLLMILPADQRWSTIHITISTICPHPEGSPWNVLLFLLFLPSSLFLPNLMLSRSQQICFNGIEIFKKSNQIFVNCLASSGQPWDLCWGSEKDKYSILWLWLASKLAKMWLAAKKRRCPGQVLPPPPPPMFIRRQLFPTRITTHHKMPLYIL